MSTLPPDLIETDHCGPFPPDLPNWIGRGRLVVLAAEAEATAALTPTTARRRAGRPTARE
jgi:hypothetical protein